MKSILKSLCIAIGIIMCIKAIVMIDMLLLVNINMLKKHFYINEILVSFYIITVSIIIYYINKYYNKQTPNKP